MGLRGEMHDRVDLVFFHQRFDQRLVADIALHEAESGVRLKPGQVCSISRVRQRVQDDQCVVRMRVGPVANEVCTDEAGAAGYQQITHSILRP